MKKNFLGFRVGILGGGQLARMLALKAHEMGLVPHVLSPFQGDPAAQVSQNWMKGDPLDPQDLNEFFKKVDIVTFESEFLDSHLLEKIGAAMKVPIEPKAGLMAQLQDRWTQKQLLKSHGVATLPFYKIDAFSDAERAFEEHASGVVFKKRRFGYDGYGTYIVKTARDLNQFLPFFNTFKEIGFIAEPFADFRRELAISVAKNKNGDFCFLPLVETFQQDSRCLWTKGPVSETRLGSLKMQIKSMLKKMDYNGIIAFELFETSKGVLVNEIAPRVHNSAHYSLNGLIDDQFTLHLRAILNLPLHKAQLVKPGFAMWNLLGTSSKTPQIIPPDEVYMHWYGKAENRKGRKMGHINAVASTPDRALNLVKKAGKLIKL